MNLKKSEITKLYEDYKEKLFAFVSENFNKIGQEITSV
jgi:hypothetical protein